MDLIFKSQDALCFLIVPIMIITINQVRASWSSLWDDNLTGQDRSLLLKASLFLLEPIVVLFHEVGHSLATIAFGGTIIEFHYAILSGYVVPHGLFTEPQALFIYLAGNLVNIGVGYLCLLAALFVTSPPMVALLVYLGLWSIASSAIFYALMSVLGLYGDWIAIYTSPDRSLVSCVAIAHLVVVCSVVYFIKSKTTRLWFAQKTRPRWAKAYEALSKVDIKNDNQQSRRASLALAWLYYEASLTDFAEDVLNKLLAVDPSDSDALYVRGVIALGKQKADRAQSCFLKIVQSPSAAEELRAKAFMCLAQCEIVRVSSRRSIPKEAEEKALNAYTQACQASPTLADPHFRRAQILNRLKRHREAAQELQSLTDLHWLDQSLPPQVPEEMKIAELGLAGSR